MKKVLLLAALLALPVTARAQPLNDAVSDIGVDRFAHFGVSYVINDELQRNCKMSPFAATLTTIAIGAAKEQFVDDHFDRGDFAADCAGALFYQVHF